MNAPTSPAPVRGGAGAELPAYVSNGVIGLRVRDNPLAAGLTLVSGLTGRHPIREIECVARAPYPLAVDLNVDGVWLSDAAHALTVETQAYDFETGELTTRLVFKPGDVAARLEVTTFCARRHPNLACQEVVLVLDGAAQVELRPTIDTRGVEGRLARYRRDTPGEDERACDGALLWETAGEFSLCGLALASELAGPDDATSDYPPIEQGRMITRHAFRGRAGRRYVLRQMTALVPKVMHDEPDQQAVRLVAMASSQGFERVREANREEWREIWKGRIRLIDAEPRWQAITDAGFFYLMASAHGSSPASTSIFGLASWGDYHHYFGHVMWDLETFVVPTLALLQPAAAEGLLDFRWRHLYAARRNALMRGRRGLQFPWEAGPASGMEAAPLPGTAAWHEDHVTPDVAHAFALYGVISDKQAFLRDKAWPVLLGATEWISSRLSPSPRGHALLGSMGIAERATESDNPAFALFAIQAVLEDAALLARRLGETPDPQWMEMARNLALPMRGPLLTSHDGYRVNEEKGATPDPLMGLFPLWRDLPPEVERATLDHYLGCVEDYIGSPMLSALYGVWAAWSGDRDLALRLLEEGYAQFQTGRFCQTLEYRPDRFPEQPQAGPFAANTGGYLMSLLLGFTGLRPSFEPPEQWACRPVVLPAGWEAIEVERLWVRGQPYTLRARQGDSRATLERCAAG